MRADEAAAGLGAASRISRSGRGRSLAVRPGARLALLDGEPGAVWAVGGRVRVAFWFTIATDGRIARIDLIGSPDELGTLDIEIADVPR